MLESSAAEIAKTVAEAVKEAIEEENESDNLMMQVSVEELQNTLSALDKEILQISSECIAVLQSRKKIEVDIAAKEKKNQAIKNSEIYNKVEICRKLVEELEAERQTELSETQKVPLYN